MEAQVGKKSHAKVRKHGEHKKASGDKTKKTRKPDHHRKHKKSRSKKSKKRFGCCTKKTKHSKKKSRKPKTKQPSKTKQALAPAPAEDIGDNVLVKTGQPGKSAEVIPPELRQSPKPVTPISTEVKVEPKKEDAVKSKEKVEVEKPKDDKSQENLVKSNKSKETTNKEKDEKKDSKDEKKSQESKEKDKENDRRSDKESDGPKISRKTKQESAQGDELEEKKDKWLQLSKRVFKEDATVPEKEFDNVSAYIPDYVSKRHFVRNMEKNRFGDVICMDHSRVPLSDGSYIHASYVQFENKKKAILTQLPLPHTASDFWQMIIEQKVKAIALILTDVEYEQFGGNFVFPQNQDFIMFEDRSIRVGEFRQIDIQKGWEMRVLSISNGDYKSYLHVHHFKTWPHDGVPRNMKTVWQLQSSLRKYNGPIVYMSLSGCGRAGTYALFEHAHSSLHGDSPVFSLENSLEKVRNGRMHSVQNVTQYSFVYTLIAEHVLGNGFSKLVKNCGDDVAEEDMNKILKLLTINPN